MSFTITLTSSLSYLSHDFDVPIYLDKDPSVEYEIGLANLDSFKMIPKVDETNNILVWGKQNEHKVILPTGAYELNDVTDEMRSSISQIDEKPQSI